MGVALNGRSSLLAFGIVLGLKSPPRGSHQLVERVFQRSRGQGSVEYRSPLGRGYAAKALDAGVAAHAPERGQGSHFPCPPRIKRGRLGGVGHRPTVLMIFDIHIKTTLKDKEEKSSVTRINTRGSVSKMKLDGSKMEPNGKLCFKKLLTYETESASME